MKKYKTYKTASPNVTIRNLRNILGDLGLILKESSQENDTMFTCRVIIGNDGLFPLQIGSNGKGSSYEYALASGYAEFLERLQNRILFDRYKLGFAQNDFVSQLPKDSTFLHRLNGKGLEFLYDEREEYWNINKVIDVWGEELIRLYNLQDIKELKHFLTDIMQSPDRILMVPCYAATEHREVFVPIQLILSATGSNGMCAGNTEKEAILQGLCEIMERYAMAEIYYKNLTPPTIPLSVFQNTPILEKIKYLEEKRGYEVIIKDCSLGKQLPVIGVLILDRKNHTYNFKLGSDFVPYIAVDRCLNELHQSFNGFRALPMHFWDNNDWENVVNLDRNFDRITKNGSGIWPVSILGTQPSYEFLGYRVDTGLSNTTDMKIAIEIITALGFNIFIRNNSSLGFPAYHIIIPGMSQLIFQKRVYETLYASEECQYLELLKRIPKLSSTEAISLASAIDTGKERRFFSDPMTEYLLFNVDTDLIELDVDLLLCMLYYYGNDFSQAKCKLDKFLKGKPIIDYLYFHAASFYMNYRHIKEYDSKETEHLMISLFGSDLTTEVINDLKDPSNVFQYYAFPTCFDCENCRLKDTCKFPDIVEIERKLNENAKRTGISYKQNLTL